MYIDYKCTIWQRLEFDDETDIDFIIKELERGVQPSELCDEDIGFTEMDVMFDTEEFLPPEENDGQSTIEVYEDRHKLIWDNSIKK